jgi:hypothetical protein
MMSTLSDLCQKDKKNADLLFSPATYMTLSLFHIIIRWVWWSSLSKCSVQFFFSLTYGLGVYDNLRTCCNINDLFIVLFTASETWLYSNASL